MFAEITKDHLDLDNLSDFSKSSEHIDAHAPADLQPNSKDPSASHSSASSDSMSSSSNSSSSSSSDSEGSDHPAASSDAAPKATATTRSFANRTVMEIAGLGELRYYHQTGMMAAACLKHSSRDCRKSATARPKTIRHAGRPIGQLVAWLQQQSSYECQTTHVHTCLPSHSERIAAREFFSRLPHSAEWLGWEKTKRPGDPDEPP